MYNNQQSNNSGGIGGPGSGSGAGSGDQNDDHSPNYSRPPSSTFRGYSFMNFRNDSVSSVENQKILEDIQSKSHNQKERTS